MMTDDIDDKGSTIIIKVSDTKRKIDRIFTIASETTAGIDVLHIFRHYVSLRPSYVQYKSIWTVSL